VDKLQEEVGQGPCLDAAYQEETVRVADMASETRWPLFAARALAAGAGSMLAFQLYVEHDNLGALNLYSYEAHSFDDESEHVGLLFASHGQAQGILMERHKISGDQAFAVLARASQNSNIKLRDVAEHLVLSGLLDTNTPGNVPPSA
jgi:hypothetical protein